MKATVLISILMFMVLNSTAQVIIQMPGVEEEESDYQGVPVVDSIIDKFFKYYEENSPGEALQYLYKVEEKDEDNKDFHDNISDMTKQLEDAEQVFGELHGYDLIDIQRTGEAIVAYSYLVKYQDYPLTFVFVYYNADNEWQLLNFNYSDGIGNIITDRMKHLQK
ncbi:MAG: hypothetical protein R6U11_04780 [Bacteroidales bacterium]